MLQCALSKPHVYREACVVAAASVAAWGGGEACLACCQVPHREQSAANEGDQIATPVAQTQGDIQAVTSISLAGALIPQQH